MTVIGTKTDMPWSPGNGRLGVMATGRICECTPQIYLLSPTPFWKVGFDPIRSRPEGMLPGHALDEPNGPSQHLEEFQFHCGGLAFAGANNDVFGEPRIAGGAGLEERSATKIIARRIDRLAGRKRRDHLRRTMAQAV